MLERKRKVWRMHTPGIFIFTNVKIITIRKFARVYCALVWKNETRNIMLRGSKKETFQHVIDFKMVFQPLALATDCGP